MNTKIVIDKKEYNICTNAFCLFEYKKQFKTGMIADIGKMTKYNERIAEIEEEYKGKSEAEIKRATDRVALEEFDNILQIPLQLAYIFIKSANRNFTDFETWLKTIEYIDIEEKWIGEVTELAVDSFLGQGARRTTEVAKNQIK